MFNRISRGKSFILSLLNDDWFIVKSQKTQKTQMSQKQIVDLIDKFRAKNKKSEWDFICANSDCIWYGPETLDLTLAHHSYSVFFLTSA